jgi:hypothetical protein
LLRVKQTYKTKQENKNMTKEEELKTIYEQKRATSIWIEAMLQRAWAERQEAFRAWQVAIKESKAK